MHYLTYENQCHCLNTKIAELHVGMSMIPTPRGNRILLEVLNPDTEPVYLYYAYPSETENGVDFDFQKASKTLAMLRDLTQQERDELNRYCPHIHDPDGELLEEWIQTRRPIDKPAGWNFDRERYKLGPLQVPSQPTTEPPTQS